MGAKETRRAVLAGSSKPQPLTDCREHFRKLIRLECTELPNGVRARLGYDSLGKESARTKERDSYGNLKPGAANARRVWYDCR